MSDAPSSSPGDVSHWCYHCNKRVSVETLDDFVVCLDCNKGFVEPIHAVYSSPTTQPTPISPDLTVEDSSIGSHFLQMLRLITLAPPQRSPSQFDVLSYEDEFFRLELDNRNEIEDEEDEEEEEEEEEENSNVNFEEDEEEENQREILPRTGRNRILDWAEILMGIENNSIEFRMETDQYTGGNPADYIEDDEGYEALLQNLAEGDGGGRKGAPPAAKSVIEALETFKVGSLEEEGKLSVCAVCKDGIVIGEIGKKLPCGHSYHGNCIVPWLSTRNSCPVCRFQLETDDAEYEKERKKKTDSTASSSASASRF